VGLALLAERAPFLKKIQPWRFFDARAASGER
jgi:hypothetical protein